MNPSDSFFFTTFIPILILLADLCIRIGLSLRVVMQKRAYSITMAWLLIIVFLPFLGYVLYMLFGENRLPERRLRRMRESRVLYLRAPESLLPFIEDDWHGGNLLYSSLHRLAQQTFGMPALRDNALQLYAKPTDFFKALILDIDQAQTSCYLQFYIWCTGGEADAVAEALIRAAQRGVDCRVLLDDIGSRSFLRSRAARIMRQAGVRVENSLPAALIWMFFTRLDIRNHRKLVVIDNTIAYSGSQNMADPSFFKPEAGVGEWIDLMVRLTGPVVGELKAVFAHDWFQETTEFIPLGEISMPDHADAARFEPEPMVQHAPVQLAPSGPGDTPNAIHSLLLTTIYSARSQLTLTTPYFIPDDGVVEALQAAAHRGVDVRLIVPVRCDSRLAQHASRARFEELARAGVRICLFAGGLLHAKTICVDKQVALIGSVNLDMRSFWLNFEATLIVYCADFAKLLATEQERYMEHASELDLVAFSRRGWWPQFKENICLLLSPLL
ncbi:MAG: cardiolipin synthase [Desulfobulbaceae bacterium]|nr:cardiolipin synthase [Desulfobulbaceae bacterium]